MKPSQGKGREGGKIKEEAGEMKRKNARKRLAPTCSLRSIRHAREIEARQHRDFQTRGRKEQKHKEIRQTQPRTPIEKNLEEAERTENTPPQRKLNDKRNKVPRLTTTKTKRNDEETGNAENKKNRDAELADDEKGSGGVGAEAGETKGVGGAGVKGVRQCGEEGSERIKSLKEPQEGGNPKATPLLTPKRRQRRWHGDNPAENTNHADWASDTDADAGGEEETMADHPRQPLELVLHAHADDESSLRDARSSCSCFLSWSASSGTSSRRELRCRELYLVSVLFGCEFRRYTALVTSGAETTWRYYWAARTTTGAWASESVTARCLYSRFLTSGEEMKQNATRHVVTGH
ncbi:hypothetical protein C8R45DRAFT_942804 [Mycena sanguinolenta]|nr:hypothetical protein C8R45DRAFT_942804 [Mycena sanguinolenta]